MGKSNGLERELGGKEGGKEGETATRQKMKKVKPTSGQQLRGKPAGKLKATCSCSQPRDVPSPLERSLHQPLHLRIK